MMLCRLCGNEKTEEQLVISLLDPTNILTFKEFVEYYCQISLDPCTSLPQKVCKSCKVSIDRFAAFSCKVIEAQKTLRKDPVIEPEQETKTETHEVEVSDATEAAANSDVPGYQSQESPIPDIPVQGSAALEKTSFSPQAESSDEPSTKKPKLDQSSEDDLLQEISVDEQTAAGKKSKTVLYLQEIDMIFNPIGVHCESIQIPAEEVGPKGKVPNEWLSRFEDFTSWEDFGHVECSHCKIQFGSLFEFTTHCATLPVSERSIKCHLCDSPPSRGVSYLGTYVNHLSREHYPHIKFCCIICSEVYKDMKNLSTHYQTSHSSEHLSIFPCLDCGYYSHCISALRTHKRQHDPKI